MELAFSMESGSLAIMLEYSKSYILTFNRDGAIERFSTINPQPGVDYDETGRRIKIIGVDDYG